MLSSKDAPAWLTYLTRPVSAQKPNVNPLTSKVVKPAPKPAWLTKVTAPVKPAPKKVNPIVGPVVKPTAPVAKKPTPKVAGTSSAITATHPAAPVATKPVAAAPVKTTTAAATGGASNNGLPAGDPWNGLTQKEVSDIIKRAKTGVAIELDPQIQTLKDSANLTQKQAERLQQQSDLATNKTVAEQKELYSRLVNSLQGMQGQVAGNYDDTAAKVGQNYGALQSALASRFGAAQTDTGNELARLGLQAATPAATAQSANDANFLQGLAGADSAAAQTSIGMSKDAAVQNLLNNIGNSQVSGTRLTAQTLQDALAATNERNNNTSDSLTALLSQASALSNTRRGMEYESSNALQDQLRATKAASQQQAFDNAMAEANLGVKQQLAGTDANYKAGQLQISQDRLNLDAKKTNAQLDKELRAATPGTLEYQQIQAAINLKNAQTAAAIVHSTGAAHTYGKGMGGVQQYVGDKQSNIGPQTQTTIINAVNDLMRKYDDKSYTKAVAEMKQKIGYNKYDSNVAQALYHALAIAYGKSTT